MCGIAGLIGLASQEQITEKMMATMRRRGPDGEGIWRSEDCCLLHARLAVIDPSGGRQPMGCDWAGEHYEIVYNGELYNTRELRQELEMLGHRFVTQCDTEVVLHAYIQWGEDCLEKCNGIFAFAVWEAREKRLFLARDRIGVKPLFYMLHRDGLLFASELKTVLACPSVRAELDEEGVSQVLLLGPGRRPGSGVFRGIRELEPGEYALYCQGKLKCHRYWKLKDAPFTDSFADTAANVRELVTDAVRRQLVSDVPLGMFLSGGLDSSLICAIGAREFAKDGKQLQTFSVDYAGNDRYFRPTKFQPNSDGHYIDLMQRVLDSSHRTVVLTARDLLCALKDATRARDLPGMADVDFSLLLFCGKIKENVTVALSGECADEIFGGYPWYRDPEVRAVNGFPWAQSTAQRLALLRSERIQSTGAAFVADLYRQTLAECDILPENSPEERRTKEMVNLNFRWFMQTLLDRKDRMSMYSGLEVRVPFCDYRIAEYLYRVPWAYKDYRGREKGLLRQAMEGILPQEVLYRKKSPYPKTFDPAYFTLVRERMQALLEENTSPLLELVRPDAIRQLMESDSAWPWYGQLMNVPQTVAYLLQVDFWLREYRVDLLT